MKKLLLFLLLVSSLFAYETDSWLHDYDEALQKAQKEHKNIYLFIGADKCKYCKMFKEQTLSQKNVISALKKEYVLLYLSRDRHSIPDGFMKYGAPIHYFLNEKGEVFHKTAGFVNPDAFLDILDDAEINR
jgi:thioredoxin-related protein